MSDRDDGGQAFPGFDQGNSGDFGMTLRDWFAGQALIVVYDEIREGSGYDEIAEASYDLADAMIQERNRSQGESK